MGKALDDLVSKSLKKEDIPFEYTEKLKQQIINEITNEIINEEAEKITKKYEGKILKERIEQLKILMINGIILSFFIGIIVNQVTDLLSFWKGTIEINIVPFTFKVIFIFTFFSLIIIVYLLFNSMLKLIAGEKNERNIN